MAINEQSEANNCVVYLELHNDLGICKVPMVFFAITSGDIDMCAQQRHNEKIRNRQVLAYKN